MILKIRVGEQPIEKYTPVDLVEFAVVPAADPETAYGWAVERANPGSKVRVVPSFAKDVEDLKKRVEYLEKNPMTVETPYAKVDDFYPAKYHPINRLGVDNTYSDVHSHLNGIDEQFHFVANDLADAVQNFTAQISELTTKMQEASEAIAKLKAQLEDKKDVPHLSGGVGGAVTITGGTLGMSMGNTATGIRSGDVDALRPMVNDKYNF